MTDHQPPESAPLADARMQLMRAASAIRAAVAVAPRLTQQAGDLHAQCIDMAEQIKDLEQRR